MLPTPEISNGPKTAEVNSDNKVIEKILTPEYLMQPGPQIAKNFVDVLKIPYGPWSSYDIENPGNLQNERILAENLTNKVGAVYEKDNISFLSRDPRHFLERYPDLRLLTAMNPKLAEIFQNEFEHQQAIKDNTGSKEMGPFAYMRLPGGIDLVLKGYQHTASWQKEHGEWLMKTARNAQVICIEGQVNATFGHSLEAFWEWGWGDGYNSLMIDAVGQGGFKGVFAEIDMRDKREVGFDSTMDMKLPDLPDESYSKYFTYLEKYFSTDASRIKNSQNLKEILKMLSFAYGGKDKYDKSTTIEGIHTNSPAYVDENLQIQRQMTGLELGEIYFSDAMAAIKLLLIAKEMEEGRMEKGIIVDFRGGDHLETTYSFLKNPLYAMMTVLKNPHFVLKEQLVKEGDDGSNPDISSIYPAFSPNKERFEDMFKQICRLEFARPEKGILRRTVEPGHPLQMPMKRYEIEGRKKAMEERLEKLKLPVLLNNE